MAQKLPEHIEAGFKRGGVVTLAGKLVRSAEELPEDLEAQGYAARRAAARQRRGLAPAPERSGEPDLTKKELLALAEQHGVEVDAKANKDDIRAALAAAGVGGED